MALRRVLLCVGAAAVAGCGGVLLPGRPQAVVQNDVRLPRDARVAVFPPTLYGYAKESRPAVADGAYAAQLDAMLKAGFRVVERSLVEKAVQDYARNKRFDKTPGAGAAVYQESGEDVEAVIDLVEVGRALNARVVAASSLEYDPGLFSSSLEARLRVTDVATGEIVANCEASGTPGVLDACAQSMAQQLSSRAAGPPLPGLR